jgi:hypothetical protein
MADSVNRIVPASVSVDRSSLIGKDRENRKRGEARDQKPPPATENQEQEKGLPKADKTKGKLLDINV